MPRRTWESVGGVALEIINGTHDDELAYIQQACTQRIKARMRSQFRKHQRIRVKDTGDAMLDGAEGIVQRVNPKSVSVHLDGIGGYRFSASFLEPVA